MPSPGQEPPPSSKAKNQNNGLSKTSEQIQIKISMSNPSQEPSSLSKAPNQDLKDMDILCTIKIKIESQTLDYCCIRDQLPYQNND